MGKRKLYVYVVHQESLFHAGYRVLGVYLDKNMAENHRNNIIDKADGYISVTKHSVRGSYTAMRGLTMISHGEA